MRPVWASPSVTFTKTRFFQGYIFLGEACDVLESIAPKHYDTLYRSVADLRLVVEEHPHYISPISDPQTGVETVIKIRAYPCRF